MESNDSSLKGRFKRSGAEALGLALRLAAVVVSAAAAGILLLLLYVQNTTVHVVIFGFTSTVCIGLLAGFMSRWILKRSTLTLRFLVAAVSLLAGLLVMYLISSGMMGLSPYIRSAIDWYGLVQIAIGLFAAFIALNGFRRKPVQVDVAPPEATYADPSPVQTSISAPAAAAMVVPLVPRTRRSAARKTKSTAKKKSEKTKLIVAKKAPAKAAVGSRRAQRKVTLAAFDEHRCPYCLEEVKRNDPRGVVICPVCKAYHHKDCWDITGRCQVPHDNPL
jgi:ribosomal protein L37AE/L43A